MEANEKDMVILPEPKYGTDGIARFDHNKDLGNPIGGNVRNELYEHVFASYPESPAKIQENIDAMEPFARQKEKYEQFMESCREKYPEFFETFKFPKHRERALYILTYLYDRSRTEKTKEIICTRGEILSYYHSFIDKNSVSANLRTLAKEGLLEYEIYREDGKTVGNKYTLKF